MIVRLLVVLSFPFLAAPTVPTSHNMCCDQTTGIETQSTLKTPSTTSTTSTATAFLWPKPTSVHHIKNQALQLSPHLCLDLFIAGKPRQYNAMMYNAFQKLCNKGSANKGSAKLMTTLRIDIESDNLSNLTIESKESYTLDVGPTTRITSAEVWGSRHALETLFQLLNNDPTTSPSLDQDPPTFNWQSVKNSLGNLLKNTVTATTAATATAATATATTVTTIQDQPKYKWRGLLLDTARHYFTPSTIERTMKAMAMNKYNVLHWHITDAQSFPLLLDNVPDLAHFGAHHPTLMYTPEDVQSIVSLGLQHGIRIVPEVDVPSHTASWSAAYPEIVVQCRKRAQAGADHFKARDKDTLDPTLEKTYQVVGWVLDGLVSLFPDQYIHLGGDEVDLNCLYDDPNVMQRAVTQFGKSGNSKGRQHHPSVGKQMLQYFWDRVIQMVFARNKIPIVWQGTYDSGIQLNKKVVIQAWKCWGNPLLGVQSLQRAKKQGHSVLQSSCWYLDWDSRFTDLYQQDRMAARSTTREGEGETLGGDICAWSETMDEFNIECRLWPRALAVAEKLWSGSGGVNTKVLQRRDVQYARMLDRGALLNGGEQNGIDLNDDFCGHIAQHFQRRLLLGSEYRLFRSSEVPHFQISGTSEMTNNMLYWVSTHYGRRAAGFIFLLYSETSQQQQHNRNTIQKHDKKTKQRIAKSLGAPYFKECTFRKRTLFVFGLYGLPLLNCNRFVHSMTAADGGGGSRSSSMTNSLPLGVDVVFKVRQDPNTVLAGSVLPVDRVTVRLESQTGSRSSLLMGEKIFKNKNFISGIVAT